MIFFPTTLDYKLLLLVKRLKKIAEILEVEPHELLDGNWTINQYNNKHAYGIGLVENLYQENKEMVEKLITQLQNENKRLQDENDKLWRMNEKLHSKLEE